MPSVAEFDPLQRLSTRFARCQRQRNEDKTCSTTWTKAAVNLGKYSRTF
jgi:hypothetical protein